MQEDSQHYASCAEQQASQHRTQTTPYIHSLSMARRRTLR
jgi:hypothetical protein